ncbi:hypothetical protein BOX15_Mlig032536g1 [Macrostomum lignano]|uniref:DNA polymerase delta subunit 4 n=1 Tax=Macrostomum lignano TaxID=282301 RepID=A0A267H7K9_9PLAT|nr:hypothetical protein BOX15_Mlig032536g1 [Macrostomum lignano]
MPKRRKQVDQKISDLFPVKRRSIASAQSASGPTNCSSSSSTGVVATTAPGVTNREPGTQQNENNNGHSINNQQLLSNNKSNDPSTSLATESNTSSTSTSAGNLTQHDLTVLRDFDLNWEFGPCIGISRLQRWERAVKRGLTPPQFVRNLVLAHAGNPLYTECIWFSYSDLI